MNTKKIKELIDLMNENGLTEIEVETEGTKIKLSRKTQGVAGQTAVSAAPSTNAAASSGYEVKTKSAGNFKEVKAPMVGTFYRASAPDDAPFVEIGDVVKKGDVICIVEAMKLMNEIKAEFSGKITEVLIENAEAVEFGQTLYRIEPV